MTTLTTTRKRDQLALAVAHPITAYQITKAMREHRKQHPYCECCSIKPSFWGRGLDVHHMVPVHVDRSLAADPSNLITLCRLCHLWIGHFGNWKTWNADVEETCIDMRVTYARHELLSLRGDA